MYLLISLLLTLLFRWWIVYTEVKASQLTSGDAIAHLQYVKRFYNNGGKLSDFKDRYLLDVNDYPNGYHWLIYKMGIPISTLERWGGLFPTLWDCCLLAVIYCAKSFWGGAHDSWLLAFPFLRLFYGNSGRANHFSERAYGVLLGNVVLVCAVMAITTGSLGWWAVTALAFVPLSTSSKFGWQGTLFTALFISVFTLDTTLFAGIIGAALFSIVATRGYSLTVLKGIVRHSWWYRTYLAPRNPAVRNHYSDLLHPRTLREWIMIFLNNSVCKVISDNPLHIPLMVAFYYSGTWDLMTAWAVTGIGLLFLIATEPLKFLGEPERYLEFSIIPVFVILTRYSPTEFGLWTALTVVILVLTFTAHHIFWWRGRAYETAAQDELIKLRTAFSDVSGKRILTVPFRLSFFLGYDDRDNKFLTLFSNIGTGKLRTTYEELMPERYPFVARDLENVVEKHAIDIIVADKLLANSLGPDYYDFLPFQSVFESDRYQIWTASS